MSWRRGLILLPLVASPLLRAQLSPENDQAVWREYGLVHSNTFQQAQLKVTSYQMKDPTGAMAAWEWIRSPKGHACDLAALCNQDGNRAVVSDFNYVLVLDGAQPSKAQTQAIFAALPDKHESSWPAILTFIPQQDLVPNSARYLLGPESLHAFVPELSSSKSGFDSGAEAQLAEYRLNQQGSPARLVIFNYPTPEMARIHTAQFKVLPGVQVKRSDVLVALVLAPQSAAVADTLLSRVQYQAKITWNETPPPSPVKPLYRLLANILYLSVVLSALCLMSGLIYAGMRIYRRRYGNLDSDEAMTTLHLTGD